MNNPLKPCGCDGGGSIIIGSGLDGMAVIECGACDATWAMPATLGWMGKVLMQATAAGMEITSITSGEVWS